MSLNATFWAPSQQATRVSTEFRVRASSPAESSSQRAQSPKPIEKTIIGRNCPLASAANGFWKSPSKNAPNVPPVDFAAIPSTPPM